MFRKCTERPRLPLTLADASDSPLPTPPPGAPPQSEKTFYDYTNNRLRLDINITSLSGSEEREATEIYRFDQVRLVERPHRHARSWPAAPFSPCHTAPTSQGKLYVIEDGRCEVRALNNSMEAFCVPPYATKRGEATLGLELNTAAWSFKERDTNFELIVSSNVRRRGGCLPLTPAPLPAHAARPQSSCSHALPVPPSPQLCVPVVQAAANAEKINERAVADLWLNVYVCLGTGGA